MIGSSQAISDIMEIVAKVTDSTANVLISGESGTGKELVARAIHFSGSRSAKPFLAVNCGALTESLLESELFGHVKGAFTGAVSDRKGLFRSADGGTVLLDEIGEMPIPLQVRLLRALQEHEVTPVGSSASIKFDAHIIAATNRDLESEVANGNFREDLFYRLNVVEIAIPPLRERSGDIPLLARFFAVRTAHAQNQPEKAITEEAMRALESHDWPGNVRQLENAIERAFVLGEETIDIKDLPAKIGNVSRADNTADDSRTLEEMESSYILETLSRMDLDKIKAAKSIGIDLSTLYRKLKRIENTELR
jgi:two-component system response regulator PilR (NtrC family)